jgi:hypothetical protein
MIFTVLIQNPSLGWIAHFTIGSILIHVAWGCSNVGHGLQLECKIYWTLLLVDGIEKREF